MESVHATILLYSAILIYANYRVAVNIVITLQFVLCLIAIFLVSNYRVRGVVENKVEFT